MTDLNVTDILSKAEEIRTESIEQANSAARVGQVLKDITNYFFDRITGGELGVYLDYLYSPKGSYTDMAALGAAKPTGAEGIYLTVDDGNWNFWNGEEWEAGGLYQAALDVVGELGDSETKVVNQKSVTDELALKAAHGYESNPKTLKEVDDNLVQLAGDGYYTIMNRYIDRSSGLVTGSSLTDSKVTDYIAFDKSRGVSLKNVFSNYSQSPCSFYDENKIFLSSYDTGIIGTQDINIPPEEIPENAIFFRSTSGMSYVPILKFSLADILHSSKTEEKILRKNISDGIYTHVGYYIDKLTGNEVYNVGAKCTGYIPCIENQVIPLIGTIRTSLIADCVFFDADKKVLASFSGNQESCIAPTGAYFFRLTAAINTEASTTPNLSAVINEIHRQSGKNYNPFTEIDMYANGSNGNVLAAANIKTTKLIPLIHVFTYTLVGVYDNRGATPACVFYDANKEYISRISIPEEPFNISTIVLSAENIPENASYFRANAVKTTKAYIEAPYMAILIDIANRDIDIDTSNFVTKEIGKGLSTEDYTLVDKTKIEKIITTGDGSKYLGNDGQYHDAVGGGVTTAVVPDRLSLKSISSSSLNTANRPFVCLTFDDGPESDYTTLKPYLEAKGYVGTCYIHQDGIAGRLTNAQITEMAANGWEFGSHTKDHIMFGKQAAYPVSSGNTTIDVITSGGRNWFPMGGAAELKFYFSVSSTDTRIIRVTNTQVISDTILRLTLASVADFTTLSNREIWLHEDTVELFALPPKERLEGLGLTCNGFAYTWGAYSNLAKQVIRRNFGYARGAYGTYTGDAVDGGSFEGDFYPMDLHAVKTTELITMTSSEMDEAIADLVAKNGILVVLGHTNSGQTLYDALDTFLAKVESQKIEVTTLSKALEYAGNLAQLGSTGVAPNGDFSRGLHFAPRKSILADTQVSELPDGVIITRVNGAQAGETLPANAGTLVSVKPKSSNGFTLQMFFEYQSTRVWRRQSISLSNFTRWERLDGFDAYTTANRPTDRLSVGQRLFDTTLNKPIWYDGSKWVDAIGVEV